MHFPEPPRIFSDEVARTSARATDVDPDDKTWLSKPAVRTRAILPTVTAFALRPVGGELLVRDPLASAAAGLTVIVGEPCTHAAACNRHAFRLRCPLLPSPTKLRQSRRLWIANHGALALIGVSPRHRSLRDLRRRGGDAEGLATATFAWPWRGGRKPVFGWIANAFPPPVAMHGGLSHRH